MAYTGGAVLAAAQIINRDALYTMPGGRDRLRPQLLDAFSHENWSLLDEKQKRMCCEALSNLYCDGFGIDRVPVSSEKMKNGMYGGYSPSLNAIGLNENLFKNGTPFTHSFDPVDDSNWQLYDTIAHETRHAYQKWAVDHPEEYLATCEDKEKGLEDLRGWALNEGKYFNDENDPLNDLHYLAQPQEMDAWNFGHDEAQKAFQEIEERNGEEPKEVIDKYDKTWDKNDPEKALRQGLMYDEHFQDKMESQMMDACDRYGIKYDYSDLLEQEEAKDQEELDSREEEQSDQEEELEYLDLGGEEDVPENEDKENQTDEFDNDPTEDLDNKEDAVEEDSKGIKNDNDAGEQPKEEEDDDLEILDMTEEQDPEEERQDEVIQEFHDMEDLDEINEEGSESNKQEDKSEDLGNTEEAGKTEGLDQGEEDDLDSIEENNDVRESVNDNSGTEQMNDSEDLDQDMDDTPGEQSEPEESYDLDDTAGQSSKPEESSGKSTDSTPENTDDNDDENTY